MNFFQSLLYMLNEMSPYILLGFLIAGLLHAFVSRSSMSRHLSGRGFASVFKAAMIGIPLPLCSCGVLPTAIAMRRGGASRAASTSFLISTPQTGVDSIAATWSLLGPAFAVIRPIAALVTAMFGGVAVGTVEKEPAAQPECADGECSVKEPHQSFGKKLLLALRYGYVDLVASIGSWLVIGLVIAAAITVFVPADFFAVLGDRPVLAMLAVLVVAIPMYVCATGAIPFAMSLMLKGLSPGTALVLLMAGPAANFAAFTRISRERGRRAAVVYLAAIIVGAMAFGLAIDYLLPASWVAIPAEHAHAACHGAGLPLLPTICSAILVALLVYAFIITHNHKPINTNNMNTVFSIKGMNCNHCRQAVERAIAAVPGVEAVTVDLAAASASVQGTASADDNCQAVHAARFEANPA